MSRGRKAKTISNGSTWEELFNKSQGFYFQYIIIQLRKKNKNLTNKNAKDLLEAIKLEKNKLIDERKIKQGKLQDAEIQDELLFEIPKNWVWCKLDELSISITDGTHQTPTYVEKGRPFISATHVKPFRFIPENYKFVSEKAYQECIANRQPEIGDVLVTRVGAIGEAAVIDVELEFAFYVSVGLIKPFKKFISPEFLAFVINSPYGNLYSKGNVSSKGSSAGNFNLGRIRSFLIPLPPRCEQEMILDFLNAFGRNELDKNREYFDSEIENDVISLHQAQIYNNQITSELSQQIDFVSQLRQAFLREAMQGKLVPQDKTDEPAKILLEKIKAEKEKLIAEKKIKRDKPLPEIQAEEIPFEIPSSWNWCRLSSLRNPQFSLSYGVLVPGNDVNGGIPFIRVQDLDTAHLQKLPSKSISPEIDKQYSRTSLVGGEILICVVGSIGKTALVPDSWIGANIARAVCRFMPSKQISRKYLYYCLNSPFVQDYWQKGYKSIQPTLNVNVLEITPIPFPPLAEQKRIVEKLEKLMKFCDELETNIRESKSQAESLLQVALKEALEPKEELSVSA